MNVFCIDLLNGVFFVELLFVLVNFIYVDMYGEDIYNFVMEIKFDCIKV